MAGRKNSFLRGGGGKNLYGQRMGGIVLSKTQYEREKKIGDKTSAESWGKTSRKKSGWGLSKALKPLGLKTKAARSGTRWLPRALLPGTGRAEVGQQDPQTNLQNPGEPAKICHQRSVRGLRDIVVEVVILRLWNLGSQEEQSSQIWAENVIGDKYGESINGHFRRNDHFYFVDQLSRVNESALLS